MEDYQAYRTALSADENELLSRMSDFEEFFDDMCLQSESVVRKYVQFQSKRDDGTWINDEDDYYLGLFDKNDLFVHIRALPAGLAGQYNAETKELLIAPSEANNQAVVLHEMIHAHEHNLQELVPFYRDIVMLCLYNDLAKKIPNLDDRILDHTHVIRGDEITRQGGSHDILFFLKSLDLDFRCGYPLGTVCGYGRDEQNSPE